MLHILRESKGFDAASRVPGEGNTYYEQVKGPMFLEQYTVASVHINRGISNQVVGFMASDEAFGESSLIPTIRSDKRSNSIWLYGKNTADVDNMTERADLAESSGSSLSVSTTTFTTKIWAHHIDLGDQTDANYDEPLDLERDIANHLGRKVVLKISDEFASTCLATSVWSGASDVTPTAKWNTAATDIIKQVSDQKEAFFLKNGVDSNIGFLTRDVYAATKFNTGIIARASVTVVPGSAARVNERILAELFELSNLVIVEALRNTNTAGTAHTLAFFSSKKFLLSYIGGDQLGGQQSMARYEWSGYAGSPVSVTAERINLKAGVRFEVQYAFIFKILNADLGILFIAVIS